MRGVAAISVVLFHYTATIRQIFPHYDFGSFALSWGSYGVHLFFMISGYVILMTASATSTSRVFWIRRALRLFPTYWVCLLITLAIVYGTHFETLYRPWKEIIINFTMLQSFIGVRDFDGAYWSLSREIVFYILIGLGIKISSPKNFIPVIKWGSILWSIFGLLIICAYHFLPMGFMKIFMAASVAQYAPLFTIGILVYLKKHVCDVNIWYFLLIGSIAVLNEALLVDLNTSVVLGLIILMFILVVGRRTFYLLRNPILVWLGMVSYPLYLLHQNIGYTIVGNTYDVLGSFLSRGFSLLVVIFLAYLVHEFVEKKITNKIKNNIFPSGNNLKE